MGTEAWVKRGGERQKLLEELVRCVHAKEDELEEHEVARFRFGVLFVLLANLRTTRVDSPFSALEYHKFLLESVFLVQEIMPRIKEFARAEEEAHALLAELFSKLFQEEFVNFQTDLEKKEMGNPQQIFHAHSRVAEIEL